MTIDKLNHEDLIRIAHYISDSIPYDHEDRDQESKQNYIRILERMADSLENDSTVIVTDDYNTRIAIASEA